MPQEKMKNKKLKRFSLINLITGYALMFLLVLLVIANREPERVEKIIAESIDTPTEELFNGVHKDNTEREIVYIDRHPAKAISAPRIGIDYGAGVVLDDEVDVLVTQGRHVAVVDNPDRVVIGNRNDYLIKGNLNDKRSVGTAVEGSTVRRDVRDVSSPNHGSVAINSRAGRVDEALVDLSLLEEALRESKEKTLVGEDLGAERDGVGNLTLAKDKDIDFDLIDPSPGKEGYGTSKGDLYAYNYPSQGIGAGVGAPAIGAGVGSAGMGAGIGEAVFEGKAVPALGGVGTYSSPVEGSPTKKGTALSPPTLGGVGGLVGGAGVGGAAGLVTNIVKGKLGLGTGVGSAKGCALHGDGCAGHDGDGEARTYDFDHLPRDGALHIMMHVDGSGSILHTRKQLEIMKDTLLKDALLPYYNGDISLYDRRVTIIDGSGERTLRFFREAADKDNVLALVFQDEAQPVYHMPNFNRVPEDKYLEDLSALKSSLSGHTGLYRGIMLQVDRGKTFARSFKEFVENSWRGDGYLKKDNLKKYYWEDNQHHIKNKDGIVFSDVYHVKDEGDPAYYLNLIFEASKKVGLNLRRSGGGLVDGVLTYE